MKFIDTVHSMLEDQLMDTRRRDYIVKERKVLLEPRGLIGRGADLRFHSP